MTPIDPNLTVIVIAIAMVVLIGMVALIGITAAAWLGFKALLLFVQSINVLMAIDKPEKTPKRSKTEDTVAPDPSLWRDADLENAVRAQRMNGNGRSKYIEPEIIPHERAEGDEGEAYVGDLLDRGEDNPPMRAGGFYKDADAG